MRNEHHAERRVVDVHDRQTHPVHGNGAFRYDFGCQWSDSKRDDIPIAGAVAADDFTDAVDVSQNEMAAESLVGGERPFQIDGVASFASSQRRALRVSGPH